MFLTAKAEKSDFRKGMGLGADDYITKPFDEVDLMDAIEMRLKKSQNLIAISNSEQGIKTLFSEARANQAIQNLSEHREHRTYNKKSFIYEIGQYPKYLYYLISGNVKTTQITETGKELITNVYGKGDFIGLIDLLQNSPYNDNAICSESTEVLLIPIDDFKKVMYTNRDLSAKFIQLLAHHDSHTEAQLIDLAFSSVRKKVSNAILAFADKKDSLELDVSREDLAALAGTARESVIRTLADFKSEGLIEIKKGKIYIIKKEQLLKLPQ
jgi:CRP-like cAMP-binding protein